MSSHECVICHVNAGLWHRYEKVSKAYWDVICSDCQETIMEAVIGAVKAAHPLTSPKCDEPPSLPVEVRFRLEWDEAQGKAVVTELQ